MARETDDNKRVAHMKRPDGYFEAKGLAYKSWAAIGCIILFVLALRALSMMGSTLDLIFVGVLVGFICAPIVNWLEDRGVSRALGAFIALIVVVVAIVAVFALLLPAFTDQLLALLRRVPSYFSQLRIAINQLWGVLGERADPELQQAVGDIVTAASDALVELSGSAITSISGGILPVIGGTVSNMLMFFLGLILAYWLARDYPVLFREMSIIAGPDHRDEVTLLMAVMSRSMSGYMRGTLVTSVVGGVLTWLGLALIGHPYAGLMGILAGVLHVVPVIGPWIASAFAVISIVFDTPIMALWSLLICVLATNITGNLVSPLVMQSAVQVHPILSLIAIVLGSALGGIPGMVLAIPLSAALKGGFVYYFETRTGRQIVSWDGAMFQGTPYHGAKGEIMPSFDALADDKFFESTRLVPSEDAPEVVADERPESMPVSLPELVSQRFGEIHIFSGDENQSRSTRINRARRMRERRLQDK